MAKRSSKRSAKAERRIPAAVQLAARGIAGKGAAGHAAASRGSGRPRGKSAFRGIDIFIVALLLVPPVAALLPLLKGEARLWTVAVAGALSLFAFYAMHRDKRNAAGGLWRTPEATLHLLELAGGWPGSYLAQRIYRHKIAKAGYQFRFWLIVVLYEIAALDYMRGSPWANALRAALGL